MIQGHRTLGVDTAVSLYFFSLDTLRASLATETEHVREQLAAYTNDLISLGVDGLRLDAAKRMPLTVFLFNVVCF